MTSLDEQCTDLPASQTAIAAALDLRCYCHISHRSDDKVELVLSDFGVDRTWNISDLPLPSAADSETTQIDSDTLPNSQLSPDPTFLAKLADDPRLAGGNYEKSKAARGATLAFLYLYLRLCGADKRVACTFIIRSALPVGAGLGSSAAYSVSLASALLYLTGQLSLPSATVPPTHTISESTTHLVNSWAFVGERILHGQPSGLDNTVATLGSAVIFQRSRYVGEPPSIRSLHRYVSFRPTVFDLTVSFNDSCRSMRFLLTNTKVPRDTKTLVAGVAKRKQMDPDYINGLLQEVQQISDQAVIALDSDKISRQDQLARLEALVDKNHAILNELGVGHPSLEAICMKAGQAPYNLHTKLTGAGGGGCALTVVPDDFSEERLQSLVAELQADGFACYETAVGGRGFGVTSLPDGAEAKEATAVLAEGGSQAEVLPFRKSLQRISSDALDAEMRKTGNWAFA